MSREWNDGDMAVIAFSAGEERGMWLDGVWHVTGGRARSANYIPRRPLVVIDPEDEATLRQIGDLLVAGDRGYDDESWQDLQAALREFANPTPPKPDEPQGLGAVVEDEEGVRWVRAGKSHSGRFSDNWRCVDGEHVGYWANWSNLTAVRVLSEGVTA